MTKSFSVIPSSSHHLKLDVLRFPLIGRFLTWRWSRLIGQLSLLIVAMFVVYDGLTGSQLAASNLATVLAWTHYRGFIILALLLAGNLFCFACPFTLPRTLARKLSLAGNRWPRTLRNKWVSLIGLFIIFWLYEWLDLWSSPWLTAWLTLAYFLGSFALEALFAESPFCKYVCPLGAFNFVYSTPSPLQISAVDTNVCRNCEGKECVTGSDQTLGCGTELFVPTIQSNMDCTFCMDCARACPYENVSLSVRKPLAELGSDAIPKRWDRAFLFVALAFLGLTNAFGMVPPFHSLHAWLRQTLGVQLEAVRLLLILLLTSVALPAFVLYFGSLMSSLLNRADGVTPLRVLAARYSQAFVPFGFGVWLAHYGFHLAIGGLSIVPVFHTFLLKHGFDFLGSSPNWDLSYLLPAEVIFPLQVGVVLIGFFASLFVLAKTALRPELEPIHGFREMLPWALILLVLSITALLVFNLPMEMRGTMMMGT
jgi:polyferredoxin